MRWTFTVGADWVQIEGGLASAFGGEFGVQENVSISLQFVSIRFPWMVKALLSSHWDMYCFGGGCLAAGFSLPTTGDHNPLPSTASFENKPDTEYVCQWLFCRCHRKKPAVEVEVEVGGSAGCTSYLGKQPLDGS